MNTKSQNPADKVEQWPIEKLVPYAKNSRTHSDEQVAQIAASIKEWGFTTAVLVDESGGIIAGHGRVMAARKLGMAQVPVMVAKGWSEAQKRAYVIADNKLALNAGWDNELLALELGELGDLGFDVELTGFSDEEIKDLMTLQLEEGLTDPDDAPPLPENHVTRPGDVWVMGKHRVMCGDSTSIDAVDVLMDGAKADMVFTDPPYGIAYSSSKFDGNKGGVTNKRNKAEMIIGDGYEFDPSFILEVAKGVSEVFVWGYQYYPHRLGRGGIIVWNKKQESEADCPHGDFELCWSKNERNKMCWLKWGGFNNKEKGEQRLHTTQKPVALAEWFFENWGKSTKLVLDLFGGSGSTLIACEKTGRINRSMELDPKFVDVIVTRWQAFTGKAAHLESDGRTFTEVMGERSPCALVGNEMGVQDKKGAKNGKNG